MLLDDKESAAPMNKYSFVHWEALGADETSFIENTLDSRSIG